MKKLFILFLSVFALNNSFGNVDSLKKVLQNNSISADERVSTLKDLSFEYCFINPDSGMMYANEIYKLAKKHNNKFFIPINKEWMDKNIYAWQQLHKSKKIMESN